MPLMANLTSLILSHTSGLWLVMISGLLLIFLHCCTIKSGSGLGTRLMLLGCMEIWHLGLLPTPTLCQSLPRPHPASCHLPSSVFTYFSGKLGGARELDWFFARLTCSTTTLYEPQFSFFFWKKQLVLQNDFDWLLESHTTVCPSQWSLHRYLYLMNQCSTNGAPLHSCSMEVCTRKK